MPKNDISRSKNAGQSRYSSVYGRICFESTFQPSADKVDRIACPVSSHCNHSVIVAPDRADNDRTLTGQSQSGNPATGGRTRTGGLNPVRLSGPRSPNWKRLSNYAEWVLPRHPGMRGAESLQASRIAIF